MAMNESTEKIIEQIRQIPYGKVSTYGAVALHAGNPRGARQVAWMIHVLAEKENLPWHRIVNRYGRISLDEFSGYPLQKALLESEGVVFGPDDCIDLKKYGC
jgi:methylated-DNA-protein-cysteine methyltransferase related protein